MLLLTGAFSIGIPCFAEMLPTKYTWFGPLFGNQLCGNVLGGLVPMILGLFLLSDPKISWKYYVMACTVPSVLFLVLGLFILHETPSYLVSRGKTDEATKLLKKMANSRKIDLPGQFEFRKPQQDAESRLTFRQSYSLMFKNWGIMRVVLCAIMMGTTCRMINLGLNFVLTNVLFLVGDVGSYCDGGHSKTYILSKWDYGKLMMSQLTGVLAWFFIIPTINSTTGGVNLRRNALAMFIILLFLVSWLYLCPTPLLAVGILAACKMLSQAINTSVWINISKMYSPRIRSSLIGLTTCLMALPLPVFPYLVELLSKESHYYVTSLIMGVYLYGFIGALLAPKVVHAVEI